MKILNRNQNLLFEDDNEVLRQTVESAIRLKIDLSKANLCGANLRGAYLSGADLREADLRKAYLREANLSEANLSGAYLSGADLSKANLRGANLSGADLRKANLSEANLSGAADLNYYLTTPLAILKDQPGKIRAYKLITAKGTGPYYTNIKYKLNEYYEEKNANTDIDKQCAEGISLATLDWCMQEWKNGYEILIAEFEAKDIAAIPTATDGKFRVFRCTIVGKKDLKEIGLINDPETTE